MLWFSSSAFSPSSIPPLTNKVILVTGGNSGLGKESILQLAHHHPKTIYLAARNPAKAAQAADEIRSQLPDDASPQPSIKLLQLDLGSFDSVQQAATTILNDENRLDILMLNAGIMAHPPALTNEGYEVQFGTNHMGHALLTHLLLPLLLRTAESSSSDVRIVVLSSEAMRGVPPGGIAFPALKTPDGVQSTYYRYGQSKLANLLWGKELAARYPTLRVVIVHPGIVRTNLATVMSGGSKIAEMGWALLSWVGGVSVAQGTLNQLWAATAGKGEVKSGAYYLPVGREYEGTREARDGELARRLWEWTEGELKGYI